MLELKSYTKEEIIKPLGIGSLRTDVIAKKLKNDGYTFTTSGRGATYRITITAQPTQGLKEFAKQQFKIDTRFPDRLAHFLQLILSPTGTDLLGMNPRTISHFTYLNNHLVEDYLNAFIDCGLLVRNNYDTMYYATIRNELMEIPDDWDDGGYYFEYKAKAITHEEYMKAYNAFYDSLNRDMEDIENNLEMVPDLAIRNANCAKRCALDGWWVCKDGVCPLEVNKCWELFPTLSSLLEQYQYYEYHHKYKGNHRKEWELAQAKDEEIKRQLEEKKAMFEKMAKEIEELKAQLRAQGVEPVKPQEEKIKITELENIIIHPDRPDDKIYQKGDMSAINEAERKCENEWWNSIFEKLGEGDKDFTFGEFVNYMNDDRKEYYGQ